MKLVKFSNDDYTNLYDFASKIWFECYKDVIPYEQIDMLTHKYFDIENINKYLANNMEYYYILHNDEIAGFIAYTLYDDYLYLDKLYLKSDFRGLHISSDVFNNLIKIKGKIRLNVNQNNKLGLRSYKANGFKIIEEIKYDLVNNLYNLDYIMEKTID